MIELYESQRAMRNMRRAALHRGVVAILDVGSCKIACLVLRFDSAEPRREAMAWARWPARPGSASSAPRRPARAGCASARSRHAGDRARHPHRAAGGAEDGHVRVDHVIACFSGAGPRSYGLTGAIDLDGQVVTEQDVSRVLSSCEVPDFGTGREVLHAQPVNFALDHRSGLGDPRGQLGQRLAADLHMLTVDATAVQNLAHCVKRCDLELAGVASSAYAAGIAALVEDEQELGAACIDMGGGTTGLSVFMKKHMIYADRAHGRRSRHRRHLDGAVGADGGRRADQDLLRRRPCHRHG